MDLRHDLALDLPAVHRGVRVARNVVRHFARMQGLADREIESLVLVVSELLANAVDHGAGAVMEEKDLETDHRMRLEFRIEDEHWTLRVSDQGGGDVDEVQQLLHPDGLPDLEDERGRGFFLIAQMVDRLAVETSEDGAGLCLVAEKRSEPAEGR